MTTRTPNPRGHGGRLRAEILAAATALLDAGGDERAVTLRAVARRAGVATPSIYHHFRGPQAIMLALVREAFADLTARLRAAAGATGPGPRRQLLAICQAYVTFAHDHPERYRTMFGGLWNPVVTGGEVTAEDLSGLGADAMAVVVDGLTACVATGDCTSTDPAADAIALWLGLHGLAHQRATAPIFPWPADLTRRLAVPLAHLVD
ncbi:TetR/AcrR family transcriptional regulator [Amycolatopsis sp. NPDC005961]|uniref:TetR/AcrR family transcriptional regulator n=1 Tax=Amycolatopsis sp. NPDC005961 TaxID=3156720 RepID=UPI0033C2DC82